MARTRKREEKQKTQQKGSKKAKTAAADEEKAFDEKNARIESLPLELENGQGRDGTNFTEEQLKRKVQCRTEEGTTFEVPWCLMMQSQIFAEMWANLGQEENAEKGKPFVFQLTPISAKCFGRIVDWMRHKHGQPEVELKNGQTSGQQIWFELDPWEHALIIPGGSMSDIETVKETLLAANFLNLKSLFNFCVQECARHISLMGKLSVVRRVFCLRDVKKGDMSEEEKAAVRREFNLYSEEYGRDEKRYALGTAKKILLPPELIHPIFAKLSLADQLWLLTLNRDAYEFLAGRVRENWPKWKKILGTFIINKVPENCFYGFNYIIVDILRTVDANQNAFSTTERWTVQQFLASDMRVEMDSTLAYIEANIAWFEEQIAKNAGKNANAGIDEKQRIKRKSNSMQAKSRLNNLLKGENLFLDQLASLHNRTCKMISMNAYTRGILHLINYRQEILEELNASGMKEVDQKLAAIEKADDKLEKIVNEFWIGQL